MKKAWKSKLGLVIEPSWGVPAEVVKQLGFIFENVEPTREYDSRLSRAGRESRISDHLIKIRETGDVAFYLTYLGNDSDIYLPLRLALGRQTEETDGGTTTVTIWPDVDTPSSGTLCIDRGDGVEEYRGAVFMTLQVRGSSDDSIRYTCKVISPEMDASSAVNTDTSGWSSVIDGGLSLYDDVTVLVNAAAGAALNSSDEVTISEFGINVDSDWGVHHTRASGTRIDRPKRRSVPLAAEFVLPNSNELSAFEEGSLVKVRVRATSGTKSVTFWIPRARVTKAGGSSEDDSIEKPRVTLAGLKPTSAPAGFPNRLATVIFQAISS